LSGRLGMLKTEPGLKIIFLRAFKSLLSTGDTFSDNKQAVITSQSTIVWHILFGSLSSKWVHVQDEHVATKKLASQKYSGKT
jgi:hypothetical protein